MKQYMSSRFIGSCVIAGILLSILLAATVDLLRPDYSPSRNLLDDALVGPLGFFMRAAACVAAATFLTALIGLLLNIPRSGFLMASCVLIAVVVISLFLTALFPLERLPGGHPTLTAIIRFVSMARFYLVLIALLVTLPIAMKRNESWRMLSHATLLIGLVTLAIQVWFLLAPGSISGLVDRLASWALLAWLFLVGMRLRRVTPSVHGTAA
jgi:hypothetical protein